MEKILFIVLIAICSQVNVVIADDSRIPSKIEVQKELELQAKSKIKEFIDRLNIVNSKYEDNITKDGYLEACLNLLVGHGDDTKDNNGNVIIPAPRITVLTQNQPSQTYLSKNYLHRCRNFSLFKNAEIKSCVVFVYEHKSMDYINVIAKLFQFDEYNNFVCVERGKTTLFKIQLGNSNSKENLNMSNALYEVVLGDMELKIVEYE